MKQTRRAWRKGMEAAQAESGGAMRLYVITPSDAVEVLAAALCGDREASRLMRAITDTVGRIDSAPPNLPMLCGCCPAPLKSPDFCIGVAMPERHDPNSAIGFAICLTCASGPVALPDLAVEALRRIWPDSRAVTLTDSVGGRA